MSEYFQPVEIDAGELVKTATFTANGEYLLSGGDGGVQVWQVKDGEWVATMQEKEVECVAVSKDNRYIAMGSEDDVLVWDLKYERVLADDGAGTLVLDVDFSPDASRLVSWGAETHAATIWDITTRLKVDTLEHPWVQAAKYSPQGDQIATASEEYIRVWADDDGRLLVDVEVELWPSHGLLWFNNDHLFVVTKDSKIKQIDASTGLTISEWSVPDADYFSSIALPQHGEFIAYSTEDDISLWDTSTHAQLGLIPQAGLTSSIAFSPNDRLLAVIQERKIIIREVSLIRGLDVRIEDAALDAWKNGQLTNAEALLTAAIPTSTDLAHTLASRALVQTRMREWDAALVDAEKSIQVRSSVVGYIAKCVALVGKGDTSAAYQMYDIASLQFHSNHATILLIKAVVLFMLSEEYDDAMSRIGDLIGAVDFNSSLYVLQAYMHLHLGNLHVESGDYERAIQSFKYARLKLGDLADQPPLIISLISGWKFDDLPITIEQRLCETLLVAGHVKEASESVLRMVDQQINMSESTQMWFSEFMRRCLSAPANNNNASWVIATQNVVLDPRTQVLREWAKLRLTTRAWQDILTAATGFTLPRLTVYQVICERLESVGDVANAVSCLRQMHGELSQEMDSAWENWTRDFKYRCLVKLEDFGDDAMHAKQYDEAISQYTAALSLGFATMQDLLVKRSAARVANGQWDYALSDANEAISLNPSSPLGYERRHAALYGMARYDEATDAFETMLLKMSESSDPEMHERARHYVRPVKTKETIRTAIEDVIRDSPVVLINTSSGRLCNKSEQAAAFEATPTFTRLISSTTTHVDRASITEEVEQYFRFATFSHKWEENEPLFETVIRIIVYDLEASPAHEKLRMFCKIVREAGFNWAWSDTCCINKADHFVLQEALISMFKWYERSAMTIIFLRGVDRLARRGALTRNIWNMRAWTLQEYHASKVVRIYTEDWTPYLGLEIYNHKESPEIISEMEEATGISARALMALRPGLDDIREKLRLASTRQTTRVEDAAYSLLGIFSLSLPVLYGEGDKALGKLLAQLLVSSGDLSILAWTGTSGSFNSCLPASITVFSQRPTSHIPAAIADAEMKRMSADLLASSLDLTLVTMLYDQVNVLPVPSFSGCRMKLPCLAFKLGQVLVSRNASGRVFRAKANTLGVVEIQTQEDLSDLGSLHLVCPWIDFLLDRQPVGSTTQTLLEENTDDQSNMASTWRTPLPGRTVQTLGGQSITSTDTASLLPPSTISSSAKHMRVLQFIARLRQPFGALLLTATRRNIDEYRRIVAECLITVQVQEITPAVLDKLIRSVRVLDVL